jgi:predicted nucleic acid-binding protein
MKVLLDTNVYVQGCASTDTQARFRASFFPLLPVTVLSAVVAYELRVNAFNELTRRLVDEWVRPMERSGRVVAPTFSDWLEAASIVTRIYERDRRWRSKLPSLLNDVLIALCARRVGATVITHNGQDFRLIRRHKDFSLRILAAAVSGN